MSALLTSAPGVGFRVGTTVLGLLLNAVLLLLPVLMLGPGPIDLAVLLFVGMVSLFLLADVPGAMRFRLEVDRGRRVDQATTPVVNVLAGLVLLVTFWAGLLEHGLTAGAFPGWTAIGGVLCMGCGVLLRYAAVRRLGRYYDAGITVRLGQPLVKDGVFDVVRHPSEVGGLLLILGAGLVLESRVALASALLLYLPLVVLRVHLEDNYLRSVYGRELDAYAARVKRLFPYLY